MKGKAERERTREEKQLEDGTAKIVVWKENVSTDDWHELSEFPAIFGLANNSRWELCSGPGFTHLLGEEQGAFDKYYVSGL